VVRAIGLAAIASPPCNERASGARTVVCASWADQNSALFRWNSLRVAYSPRYWRKIGAALYGVTPMLILGEAQLVSTDHFRHELLAQLRSAAAQGATTIVVTSGELCRNIRMGSSSTHACREAMQAEMKPGDAVLVEQTSGSGMTVRYQLPRAAP
jgi:hypothetical protein